MLDYDFVESIVFSQEDNSVPHLQNDEHKIYSGDKINFLYGVFIVRKHFSKVYVPFKHSSYSTYIV